jgi:hypothetical protein
MTAGVAAAAQAVASRGPSGSRPGLPAGRATAALLLVVNVLVLAGTPAPVRAALVLPVVVLLPGAWAMRAIGLRRPAGWDVVLHAVAFGLVFLLAVSLAVAVLPVAGALSPVGCLVGFDLAMAALLGVVAVRARRRPAVAARPAATSTADPPAPAAGFRTGPSSDDAMRPDPAEVTTAMPEPVRTRRRWARLPAWPSRPAHRPTGLASIALAALAVVLAVAGAARLNAGGGGTLTALALTVGAMALLGASLPGEGGPGARGESTRDQAAATTVFLLGLAVLLATSLRGIGVTGHDIKIEMHVLHSTLAAGHWQPGGMAPDYAACLSITTLPAFLHHLLGLAPLDVFRVCYQVLFAVVGVAVFLLARRQLPTGGAVAAAGLFVAFPTFVNDMPMLNRQELALIFFAVAMLTLLDDRGSRRHRLVTFAVMAAGLTVSHYSTTYVTVGLMLFGWLLLRAPALAAAVRRRTGAPGRSGPRLAGWPARVIVGLPAWRGTHPTPPPLLGPRLVLLLVAFSVGWSVCTGSGGGLVRTVQDTMAAVQRSNSESADAVGYSFFGGRPTRTDEQVLRDYLTAHGGPADPGAVERLATACPTRLAPADILPETLAGRGLRAVGIPPAAVTAGSRLASVALFQLGAVLGVVLLWWATRRSGGPARVLTALGGAALGLLGITLALPQLSLSYGLLRLFQQFLVLLAPLVVIALTTSLGGFGRRLAAAGAATVVTACFVSTSGLLPQFLGGYQPQLNLNNAGPYYRAWYAAADDVAAARWLRASVPAGAVVAADSADTALLRASTGFDPREGVAPGIVPADAYLQVDAVGDSWAQAVLVAHDRILTITFPLRCVAAGRPLLYSRDGHLVYGPTT